MLVLEKLWKQLSLLPQWLLGRRRTNSTSALLCVREFTAIFFWPLDKFLYLILLPLGVVTLGDKVAMRRAKSLKYLRKLFGQDLTKMKIPPIFKGKLSMLNKFQAPSHTFSTARLCCSSASLHQHNLDTRRRLGCQVSRSAEHNYTELLISLLKNCHKHQT